MIYLFILILLVALELIYFRIADHFNIIDRPNERSSHRQITLRGGGVIFYFGALVYFLHSGCFYPCFFAGLTLVSVVSFIDDVKSLSPKLRLTMQLLAMLLMSLDLGISTSAWWLIPVFIFIAAGITNVYNFMDGINGITGGYSLVVLVALAYVNHSVVPGFIDQHLIYVATIAALVFCFFNFRTHARCFAGDVGSVSMAFIIVFIIGRLCIHTNSIAWLTFLVVYGVDGVMTIIHRIQLGEELSKPHRKHAFQLMANELKMPHVVVSLIYMAMQATACAVYVALPGYGTFVVITLILALAYLIFMRRYYRLHEATLKMQHKHETV